MFLFTIQLAVTSPITPKESTDCKRSDCEERKMARDKMSLYMSGDGPEWRGVGTICLFPVVLTLIASK